MLSVLKTILSRLETIEKQLEKNETIQVQTAPAPVSVKQAPAVPTKVVKLVPVSTVASPDIAALEQQAKTIIIEAKDEAYRIKREAEEESRKVRQELLSLEQRVSQKEENWDRKIVELGEKEKIFAKKEQEAQKRLADIDEMKSELITKLEKVAQLTREDAKKLILSAVEDKLKEEMAKKIKDAEAVAKQDADAKAREILVDAMKHGATDYVAEYTVSAIKIADEDFKGRIIGKEGRNIRAFEMATGVDVDLDEEGVIRLSSFDPFRREVARISLEKLLRDGRIQPVRIEELVRQTEKEIEKVVYTEGEKLCHAVGVYNMPSDIVALLGRFKYRFSYGQNMIGHTLEETKIGIALAHEVGADVNVVKLGCLLHDIGKIITGKDGSHVQLGVELLKKYGMPESVVGCVAAHHEDIEFPSIEAVLVYIADAISGSRPGARHEDIQEYVKRLKTLEDIAMSFAGVEKTYALQAGRELRVVVDPGKLSDSEMTVTAKKIGEEIEKKFPTFPGQIKVTMIREYRVIQTVH